MSIPITYTGVTFTDGEVAKVTPVDADNLNILNEGIKAVTSLANELIDDNNAQDQVTNALSQTVDGQGARLNTAEGNITGLGSRLTTAENKITTQGNQITTYALSTGDSNGQIKVTPSKGSAYNVAVRGLGSLAFSSASSFPASDVYAWAKAPNKPGYNWSEIGNKPLSMPASDVYSWAKQPTKPTYYYNELYGVPSTFPPSAHSHDNIYSSGNASIKGSGGIVQVDVGMDSGANTYMRPAKDNDAMIDLGTSSRRWYQVYATKSTINTSDRNEKKNIDDITEKYDFLFDNIRPKTYMFKKGDRIHVGAISQDIEDALAKSGLTNMDFAGFCKDEVHKYETDENGNEIDLGVETDEKGNPKYIYGLRYEEFIMLNTHQIQKAKARISSVEDEIALLKAEISSLKEGR